jgi:hypothetical protein
MINLENIPTTLKISKTRLELAKLRAKNKMVKAYRHFVSKTRGFTIFLARKFSWIFSAISLMSEYGQTHEQKPLPPKMM